MRKPWEETRREFRRLALRVGVSTIAREIPANRTTVYRLMDGETQRPHPVTRERIETIVREHAEDRP